MRTIERSSAFKRDYKRAKATPRHRLPRMPHQARLAAGLPQARCRHGTSDLSAFAASYRLRQVPYDAILIVSFGGPERTEDVIPFLENTLRGRNVPRERMLAVAEHYYRFGGRSPVNSQLPELIAALRKQVSLPIYWGDRHPHPMLADTIPQ